MIFDLRIYLCDIILIIFLFIMYDGIQEKEKSFQS